MTVPLGKQRCGMMRERRRRCAQGRWGPQERVRAQDATMPLRNPALSVEEVHIGPVAAEGADDFHEGEFSPHFGMPNVAGS